MRPLPRHRPPQRHAGWAEYGYCASQSRDFWGPRLHLIATLGGLPIAFAITGAKADERQTLLGILDADPALAATRPGQTLIADRQYYCTAFEAELAAQHLHLLRPARKGERYRPNVPLFKPLCQTRVDQPSTASRMSANMSIRLAGSIANPNTGDPADGYGCAPRPTLWLPRRALRLPSVPSRTICAANSINTYQIHRNS